MPILPCTYTISIKARQDVETRRRWRSTGMIPIVVLIDPRGRKRPRRIERIRKKIKRIN